jgi:anti-sigma factor RsiW
MKCNKVTKRLSAWLDGEVSGTEKDRISRHLEKCANCRQELEILKADANVLRAFESPDASPYLLTRVMAEVRAEEPVRMPARRPWWQRAMPIAAGVLLVAGGLVAGTVMGNQMAGTDTEQQGLLDGTDSFAEFAETVLVEE